MATRGAGFTLIEVVVAMLLFAVGAALGIAWSIGDPASSSSASVPSIRVTAILRASLPKIGRRRMSGSTLYRRDSRCRLRRHHAQPIPVERVRQAQQRHVARGDTSASLLHRRELVPGSEPGGRAELHLTDSLLRPFARRRLRTRRPFLVRIRTRNPWVRRRRRRLG